ncbi:AsnC family transcriptional regulator [Yersinia enterocolitica]|uniref:Lrp/AsnC family transcriptional regulator n=1 Tax=Yersinia enterocolitica TaxID=630 RepID=UPI0005E91222|nr:Lrp/AsnC family transcriptional regulator [Yersinia enterocolitica]CNG75239.1 AsnC family transcriptional regulator [Yersinia enterocolitica]
MDSIDRKIIAELQHDGRISLTDLADRIGISLSPCHRRVKTLEQNGVIQGYRAMIDPSSLGFGFSTLVFVTLRDADRHTVTLLDDALSKISAITHAQRLFGDPDYLLHVVARDLPSFQKLYDEKLIALPGVQRLTSTLVMKTVVPDRAFPVQ